MRIKVKRHYFLVQKRRWPLNGMTFKRGFYVALLSGETWSEEASDLFEELSHAAKWKILMARTVTYRQTEDASVPCIELIDTNGKTVQKTIFKCFLCHCNNRSNFQLNVVLSKTKLY